MMEGKEEDPTESTETTETSKTMKTMETMEGRGASKTMKANDMAQGGTALAYASPEALEAHVDGMCKCSWSVQLQGSKYDYGCILLYHAYTST